MNKVLASAGVTVTKKNGAGVYVYGPNSWSATGHCRRCDNGGSHTLRRRGAGGEKSTGTLLQRPGRHVYENEIAPGEKPSRRRRLRHAEKAAVRKEAGQ
jgi:hypothetical protein